MIQRHFDEELADLKKKLLHMGSLVQEMIHLAVKGLVEQDESMAKTVFGMENEVNGLHIEIDNIALRLIALHQPMAADLRLLATVVKINSEIERIADLAVNMCESTHFILAKPLVKPLIDLPEMAEIAQKMVSESLKSFTGSDVALAQRVLDEDDRVDDLKDQIFRELLTYMISDPSTIDRAISLILISRNIERIGDHATNIAEDVIYMVQGRDVRHKTKEMEKHKY
ncbi:MAG: phosphate transport system regulatory protein PhoU [Planctomycetes bacterium GWA2_50_13]|nr:MAG: phosphate transport system regulatory protein PhoU [Planctomycetes bacterium GWA2_50_13]OHB95928.1 MAG: phosphate transport system regulatory protein PhoU [Planctomycetes bacterium RIFCSPLOWO2_02_FULL_50_16]OHC02466.1 MAG: phosphate transport system regulatory protein PhoU [Planctomycetes bacterium RIFCSPLOWO2_12_FULL_50_35]HCN18884.1 phosphate transport system regulatory protein PhoU [Planctomycetia bacterium]